MTKAFLHITVICATMLSASAWAQSQGEQSREMSPDQSSKSWSSKHLSATGRTEDRSVRASKLSGAQVNDSSGNRIGQIQDILVNPQSGRIDFAVLSLNASGSSSLNNENSTRSATGTPSENGAMTSSTSGKLVPVPWSLLKTSASSQYSTSSEQPVFTLNVDQTKLNSAPTISWSDLSQSQWRQRVYTYYGVSPDSSMGGAESPQGEIKGEPARKLTEPSQQPQNQ